MNQTNVVSARARTELRNFLISPPVYLTQETKKIAQSSNANLLGDISLSPHSDEGRPQAKNLLFLRQQKKTKSSET
jgi:hypothetical protein